LTLKKPGDLNIRYVTLKKPGDLNIRYITIIQLAVALIISLLFQFVIPYTWQPLYAYGNNPNIKHGGIFRYLSYGFCVVIINT